MSAIDINGVGHHLEEIEGYTYGQDDPIHHEASALAEAVADIGKDIKDGELRPEQVIKDVGEEIGVLEVAEQSEINDNAKGEPECGFPLAGFGLPDSRGLIYSFGDEPVGDCHEDENEQEESTGLIIEEPADRHEEDITQVKSG